MPSGGNDLVHLPVQRLPGQAEGEAGRRLTGHVGRAGQRVPVDEDVDHDGPAFMAERGLQALAYVPGGDRCPGPVYVDASALLASAAEGVPAAITAWRASR